MLFSTVATPIYIPTNSVQFSSVAQSCWERVVLRRTPGCAGGRAVYVEEYVTVPVGCTCVPGPDKDADAANSSLDKSARP